MSKYGVFSGPYFLAFRLNTERYGVSLCILSECGKIRTRKAPYFDTFHAVYVTSTHSRTEINYLAYSKNRFENNDTCYQNLRILLFLSKLLNVQTYGDLFVRIFPRDGMQEKDS